GGGVWSLAPGDLAGLTITSPDNLTFALTVAATSTEASDGSTATVTQTAHLTFANVPPTAHVSAPSRAVRGQTIMLGLSATDPSSVDPAAGFTYQINWGDGSPVQTVLPGQPATVGHAYAASGTPVIHVTATDKDGGVSASVSQTIVVDAIELEPSPGDP